MEKRVKYSQLFNQFNDLTVLIIGDVMLDAYLWGKVDRISPEAPIPVVDLKKRENRMGGAANVALNVKALGCNTLLCSVIGTDERGNQFTDLMKESCMDPGGLIRSRNRITTTKFRIFGNNYQMLRVDEEVVHDLGEEDYLTLLEHIKVVLNDRKVDCIIFQDYDKGVISERMISEVVSLAEQKKIPVTVDPKRKNFIHYKGVTLFKPNLKELREGLKTELQSDDQPAIIAAAQSLRRKLECDYLMTTLSEKGVLMCLTDRFAERNILVPAHQRSVADVSGAGDTVIAVASACLACGCSPYEIAYISNLAGGLVCEEVGVVPVSKEKLLKEVLSLL